MELPGELPTVVDFRAECGVTILLPLSSYRGRDGSFLVRAGEAGLLKEATELPLLAGVRGLPLVFVEDTTGLFVLETGLGDGLRAVAFDAMAGDGLRDGVLGAGVVEGFLAVALEAGVGDGFRGAVLGAGVGDALVAVLFTPFSDNWVRDVVREAGAGDGFRAAAFDEAKIEWPLALLPGRGDGRALAFSVALDAEVGALWVTRSAFRARDCGVGGEVTPCLGKYGRSREGGPEEGALSGWSTGLAPCLPCDTNTTCSAPLFKLFELAASLTTPNPFGGSGLLTTPPKSFTVVRGCRDTNVSSRSAPPRYHSNCVSLHMFLVYLQCSSRPPLLSDSLYVLLLRIIPLLTQNSPSFQSLELCWK
ncbi:unnamed protein product [Calypogeia fissa]